MGYWSDQMVIILLIWHSIYLRGVPTGEGAFALWMPVLYPRVRRHLTGSGEASPGARAWKYLVFGNSPGTWYISSGSDHAIPGREGTPRAPPGEGSLAGMKERFDPCIPTDVTFISPAGALPRDLSWRYRVIQKYFGEIR